MLKPYATRVDATYDLVVSVLQHLDRQPGRLRKAVTAADARARARDAQVPVAFAPSKQSVPFKLKGYAFSQVDSDISGDTWVRYDPTRPKTWTVPFFRDLVATDSVRVPAAYVIPAGWPQIADKLRQHGIRTERIAHAVTLPVERYRLAAPAWSEQPFEGHHRLREVSATLERAEAEFDAGAILVPMDQPAANVALNLLEPRASDSLLRWGFLDTVFEQKEYADARVAEQLARDMLAQDPSLKAAFEARLAADPAFAKSPQARLAYFYDRSPWGTVQQVGLYPIVRLDATALAALRTAPQPNARMQRPPSSQP